MIALSSGIKVVRALISKTHIAGGFTHLVPIPAGHAQQRRPAGHEITHADLQSELTARLRRQRHEPCTVDRRGDPGLRRRDDGVSCSTQRRRCTSPATPYDPSFDKPRNPAFVAA